MALILNNEGERRRKPMTTQEHGNGIILVTVWYDYI